MRLALALSLIAMLATGPAVAQPSEVERLREELARLTAASEQNQSELARMRAAQNERGAQAGMAEAERAELRQEITALRQTLAVCQARNAEAIRLARTILDRYERVSVGQVLAREPFLGLARVQLERMTQELGDRVYDTNCLIPVEAPRSAEPSDPIAAQATPPAS